MICGEQNNIWPMPTGKTTIGSRSLTFSLDAVSLQIDTKFSNVKTLFHNAFSIFLNDLKLLIGPIDASNALNKKSTQDSTEMVEQHHLKKNCDINKLIIFVLISNSPEINLNLETDESYNLTMSSKLYK